MIAHDDPFQELAGLRALARSLVHGEADADDLLQDAAVAVLQHPPELDRPVRPWLAKVIVNRWRMDRRSSSRRRAREAAIETPVADEVDPGERAEMMRRLAEAVSTLAEPYRYTVIARYFDGKTSNEIAREQGIPAITVRTRLSRALEQLRGKLDEAAPRKKWQRALIPAPFVKASWFATAKASFALVAFLLALLVGGAIALWPHGVAKRTPSTSAAVSQPPVSRVVAPPTTGARVEAGAHAGGAASGRVVDRTSGQGVANADLTFTGANGTVTIKSGDDGSFELAPPNAGDYTLSQVVADGYLAYAPDKVMEGVHVTLARDRAVRGLVVYVAPAIDVQARVVDELGHPVAGATVSVIGDPGIDPADASWTSDRDGTFTFHAAEGAVLEAVAGERRGWARVDANMLLGKHVQIAVARVPARVQVISGHVLDDAGAPLENVLVHAYPSKEMNEKNTGSETHPPAFAYTDATGTFELRGLDKRAYELDAEMEGRATALAKRVPSGTHDVKLVLSTGEVLAGVVVTADGTPVPAYTLMVSHRDGAARDAIFARTIVDPDGKFAVRVAPGTYDLDAEASGYAPGSTIASPGDAVRVVVAAGATLRGKVVSAADGKPIAHARVVREVQSHAQPASVGALTDADGMFELDGIPPGPFMIDVSAAHHNTRIEWRNASGRDLPPIVVSLAPLVEGNEPHVDYVGVGISTTADGDAILVEMVTPGGPAESAGVRGGDQILTIDGISSRDIGEPASVARIRGLPGTTVTFTIRRGDRVLTIPVTRSQVQT